MIAEPSLAPSAPRARPGPWLAALVAGGLLTVGLIAALAALAAMRPPSDGSPEAGFARDMAVHHAQAVQMAEIVRDRTTNEEIRVLARDIALTQQAQIGRVQGWLDVWGLSPTGSDPPMAWMGGGGMSGMAGMAGPAMPGMATPEQVTPLQTLPPAEADLLFLRLMVPHHRAAVDMAQAILARTGREEVRALAQGIVVSQQAEIAALEDLRARLEAAA